MRIAIPVSNGVLDPHFGHCQTFSLLDVDQQEQKVLTSTTVSAPPHEPGLLPAWLAEQGANLVLAGGMGGKAVQLFRNHGVEVIVGVPSLAPEAVVNAYFAGEIGAGTNACDH